MKEWKKKAFIDNIYKKREFIKKLYLKHGTGVYIIEREEQLEKQTTMGGNDYADRHTYA